MCPSTQPRLAQGFLAPAVAGPPASTKQMVESVSQLGRRRPDLLGKSLAGIESLVKNARLCIEAGDLSGAQAIIEFDPGSFVLTVFGRCNTGTIRGDVASAERYLNLFFRI